MMLSQLFPDQSLSRDVRLLGLADDSRRVQAGYLFCACPGDTVDGRQFMAAAVAAGAVALACEPPAPADADGEFNVPVVEVENLRHQLGSIAATFYGKPSQKLQVIAVTGTNGKTSFTHFLAQALNATG
ncbi:MAG: Mur ligase domain-containing protein, partial [Pseudomonadales bacterium]